MSYSKGQMILWSYLQVILIWFVATSISNNPDTTKFQQGLTIAGVIALATVVEKNKP